MIPSPFSEFHGRDFNFFSNIDIKNVYKLLRFTEILTMLTFSEKPFSVGEIQFSILPIMFRCRYIFVVCS